MVDERERFVYSNGSNKWGKESMRPKTIFCLVSRHHYAGKTHAARSIANECFRHAGIFEFSYPFMKAAAAFHDGEKDEPNALGITKRDIAIAFSDALRKLHPEMPTYQKKLEILDELATNDSVVILPDIRRIEEFEWLRSLRGKRVHVIEIAPLETNEAHLDDWITPEVEEQWGKDRFIVVNDGTRAFTDEVVALCLALLENK